MRPNKITLFLASLTLLAQTSEQPVIRVTTRLVEVNVIVRDKDGPADYLSKDDFTLFDKGKPQKIAVFSVNRNRAAEIPPVPRLAGVARKPNVFTNRAVQNGEPQANVAVVLLDGINTEISDQANAKKQCIQFLSQIRPDDRIAVYALGTTLRVLQDFTSDPQRLVNMLARYRGENTGHMDASNPTISNTGDDEMDQWINDSNAYVADYYLEDRVNRTVAAMEAIANHIGRVPGRKSLIWVSGSFPFTIGVERDITTTGDMHERGTFGDQVRRATRALNDANVAVYPVDARGLIGVAPVQNKMTYMARGSAASSSKAQLGPQQTRARQARQGMPPGFSITPQPDTNVPTGQESMRILAQETGGRAFYDTNDIQGAIRTAVNDSEVTYTLGFYPDSKRLDSKFHDIKVQVKQPGLEVRFRKGYLADPGGLPVDQRTAVIEDAARSPLDATGISLTAQIETVNEPKPGLQQITLSIDLNDLALQPQNNHWAGTFDLVVSQRAQDGRDLGTTAEAARMNLEQSSYEAFKTDGLTFHKLLELVEGASQIRLVVVDRASGRLGSLSLPVKR